MFLLYIWCWPMSRKIKNFSKKFLWLLNAAKSRTQCLLIGIGIASLFRLVKQLVFAVVFRCPAFLPSEFAYLWLARASLHKKAAICGLFIVLPCAEFVHRAGAEEGACL